MKFADAPTHQRANTPAHTPAAPNSALCSVGEAVDCSPVVSWFKRRERGVTLIELLVVTAIMSCVIIVVAACLSGGLRVWDVARTFSVSEGRICLGAKLMERDLRSAFRFAEIGFNGSVDAVVFPGLAQSVSEDAFDEVCSVKYFFDEQSKALFRKTWTYDDPEPSGSASEAVVEGLDMVRFEYGYLPEETGQSFQWRGTWEDGSNFPSVVQMTFSFKNEGSPIEIKYPVIMPLKGGQ